METLAENTNWLIAAEVELVYRHNVKPSLRPQISSPGQAAAILKNTWDESKLEFTEQFKVMLLSRSFKVLGILELSSGGTISTVVDQKLIYIAALKANAHAIILAHNHPSGNLKPSEQDEKLTRTIVSGCRTLGIDVEDHIIITEESYFSFTENGLI